jgi:hypothetical protein
MTQPIKVRNEIELDRKLTALLTSGVSAVKVTRGKESTWVMTGEVMDRIAARRRAKETATR